MHFCFPSSRDHWSNITGNSSCGNKLTLLGPNRVNQHSPCPSWSGPSGPPASAWWRGSPLSPGMASRTPLTSQHASSWESKLTLLTIQSSGNRVESKHDDNDDISDHVCQHLEPQEGVDLQIYDGVNNQLTRQFSRPPRWRGAGRCGCPWGCPAGSSRWTPRLWRSQSHYPVINRVVFTKKYVDIWPS